MFPKDNVRKNNSISTVQTNLTVSQGENKTYLECPGRADSWPMMDVNVSLGWFYVLQAASNHWWCRLHSLISVSANIIILYNKATERVSTQWFSVLGTEYYIQKVSFIIRIFIIKKCQFFKCNSWKCHVRDTKELILK